MPFNKIIAAGAVVGAITTILGFGWNGYSMIVDIHGQYATKGETRSLYFQTMVDDLQSELLALRSRREFYKTKMDIEGELPAGDRLRLEETIAEIRAKEPVLEAFKQSIHELSL